MKQLFANLCYKLTYPFMRLGYKLEGNSEGNCLSYISFWLEHFFLDTAEKLEGRYEG